MGDLAALATRPEAWIALLTLIVMEVVLGIDNLVFVSIVSNKLPADTPADAPARIRDQSGAGVAGLVLLSAIAFIVSLTKPVLTLPFAVPSLADGHPMVDLAFSWRDLILLGGGLFLVWKATNEMHHAAVEFPEASAELPQQEEGSREAGVQRSDPSDPGARRGFLDRLDPHRRGHDQPPADHDGRGDHRRRPDAGRLGAFGALHTRQPKRGYAGARLPLDDRRDALIAEAFGVHVPKAYIYAAMAFSGLVEGLNMTARNRRRKPPGDERTLH